MEQYQIVYNTLTKMNIPFEVVEHPPAWTTAEADKYIDGKEGLRTKTLFLTNKKKNAFYLVIMDGAKRLDMDHLATILNEKRISFGSSERLMEKMGLSPGFVSIFGLLNNDEHDIKVYLDKEMLSERLITFHPNDNTKTLFMSTEDMYKFITTIGYEYTIVEL
ncbi:prolyl-tRNA synthetase associated domain-containing protein [Pradoshia sp. D12]|uniref:prolyl-tRNA synthetase associated domain-containing protein n=1 Tax=Bacillaceae TaxID=186817 RepID=UPI00112B8A51|nr:MULTISPECIES: prolyl-tRNA synthetase associated domain-containing protein [Bacillaceae]QFK71479.1 prolyl-tRNA synthetase associated domain-containing protein [Pradoshia sp. D12]TPF73274.1 prolyl-tRNA synthetase associated domain-containing protein [Bacillus sp. D12]